MAAAPYAAVATLAGAGRRGRVDGHRADRAYFDAPRDAASLPNGDVVLTDGAALRLLSLATDAVTTLQTLPFLAPRAPTVIDGGAGLVVADAGHHKLRLLQLAYSPGGGVSVVQDVTLAGTGRPGLTDGPADGAEFCRPCGVCVLADGSLLVSDSGNAALRRVHGRPGRQGLFVTTVVGGGGAGHADGGPATARLSSPGALALDPTTGAVLVADAGTRSCVRALHPPPDDALTSGLPAKELPPGSWALTTIASLPPQGEPAGLLVTHDGRLLVADAGRNVLRLLEPAAPGCGDADARAAPRNALHTLLGDVHVCVVHAGAAAAGSDAAGDAVAAADGAAATPAATAVVSPRLLQRFLAAASPADAAGIVQRLRRVLPATAVGAAAAPAAAAGRPAFHFSGAPSPTAAGAGFSDAAATAAVTRLQAECHAAVVPYHDVARVAALHARFASESVLAGAPPPPRALGSTARTPHGQLARGAALSKGAGMPHAVPPAFVRVQHARSAAAAAAVQLYADGSPPSEARLRRPAGMCPLLHTDLPGCVVVCDGGNALLRLLVSTEAAVSEAAAPALGRLVPPELLAKAAATARKTLADAAAATAAAAAADAAAARHAAQQREAAAALAAVPPAKPAPPPQLPPASQPTPAAAAAARHGVKPQASARGRAAGGAATARRLRAPSVSDAASGAGKPLHVHDMRATAAATALLQQAASIAAAPTAAAAVEEEDGEPAQQAHRARSYARGDALGLSAIAPQAGYDDSGGPPSPPSATTAASTAQSPPPSRALRQQHQLLSSSSPAAAADLDFLAALSLAELVPPSPPQQPPPRHHEAPAAAHPAAVGGGGMDPRDVRALLADLHGHLTPDQTHALQQALLDGGGDTGGGGGGGIASTGDRAERWAKLRARAVTPTLTSSIARRRDGGGSLPPAPRASGASSAAAAPSPSLPRVASSASVTSLSTSRVGGSGSSVAGSGGGGSSGPVYANGAEPRLVRSGALSASFLAEQLCPSRNAYTSPATTATAAATSSRDALAAEDAGPAAQAVRAYLAQLQQQQPAAADGTATATTTTAGAPKRLLQARFTHHTAASATRARTAGRPAVHASPAYLNLTGLQLGDKHAGRM
jgi:hypothetical protein